MVDGVLLDWEGVLADTGTSRRESLLRALTDEGVPFDVTAYDERCLGQPVPVAAAVAIGTPSDQTLSELVTLRARRAFSQRLAQGFALRRGASRFVELAQLRAPVAIVTNATRSETDTALLMAGLLDACAAIVTADDMTGSDSMLQLYERALTQLHRRRPLRRDHVLVVADTRASLRAARAAGVRTIAIGAPAHIALEADAAIEALDGVTMDDLCALAGIPTTRHA